MNLDVAKDSLLLLKSVFDKHGLRFWLHAGTLLGAIRENNFISYDTDIDICIFRIDLDKYIETLPDLRELGFCELESYLAQDFIKNNKKNLHVNRHIKDTVGIDIYPMHWYGNYWGYVEGMTWEAKHFPEKCCKGFDIISFLGEDFLIPKNVEEFLLYSYGKDWRIPTER